MGIRCLGLADTIVTPGNSLCMQVSSAASKTLPRAAVELAVAGQVHKLPTLPPSLNPRLPANSHHFSNVPLKSNIRLKVGVGDGPAYSPQSADLLKVGGGDDGASLHLTQS